MGRGLSTIQREILDAVKSKGYTTMYDTVSTTLNMFQNDYKKGMKSAYASASRALRRLVNRGLLMKLRHQYVGYSDAFVSPDFTGDVPEVKRRYAEVEAYKANLGGLKKRLNSKLTVSKKPQTSARQGL